MIFNTNEKLSFEVFVSIDLRFVSIDFRIVNIDFRFVSIDSDIFNNFSKT